MSRYKELIGLNKLVPALAGAVGLSYVRGRGGALVGGTVWARGLTLVLRTPRLRLRPVRVRPGDVPEDLRRHEDEGHAHDEPRVPGAAGPRPCYGFREQRELRLGRDWWRRADGPEPSQMATEGRFLACERESTSQKVVMAPITQGIPPSYYPPNEDDDEDDDD